MLRGRGLTSLLACARSRNTRWPFETERLPTFWSAKDSPVTKESDQNLKDEE